MIIVIDYTLNGVRMHSPARKIFATFLDEQRENIAHFHNNNESGTGFWCKGVDLLDAMVFARDYFESRFIYPNFVVGGFSPIREEPKKDD